MANATILITQRDVDEASGGLYVVQSGTDAYFPAIAQTADGSAKIVGERYHDDGSKLVTLEIAPQSHQRGLNGSFGSYDESQQRAITIGREFFITALNDYNDWPIKWWREAVQNAVDSGARNVALSALVNDDGTYTVSCEDDGGGMDAETLLNKFLVLGATTKKSGSGAAGGFGKAKELLLLPWIGWQIHSRDMIADGSGIEYRIKNVSPRRGTILKVLMPADQYTDAAAALGFLQKCNLPGIHFTVNGVAAQANLRGGNLVDSVPGKADIHFIPLKKGESQSYLYVRSNGLYMFSSYVGEIPGFITVDLTAPSIELLTANRDGFRDYSVNNAIDKLAARIAQDNMSALRNKAGLIRQKFEGVGKFKAHRMAAQLLEQIGPVSRGRIENADADQVLRALDDYTRSEEERGDKIVTLPPVAAAAEMLDQRFAGPNHVEAALKQLVWQPDFYIMNDIENWRVPKKFFPGTMTPTILKLAKTWVELCRYVLMQLGSSRQFGVGFIFSTDSAAVALTESNKNGDPEEWLMLNPFKDMYDRTEIWRVTDNADLKWLYAAAIHEATHIADGISYHNESFASALTRNMAKCADGYRKIKAITNSIRMRGGPEID